jgi:hypothetical protein
VEGKMRKRLFIVLLLSLLFLSSKPVYGYSGNVFETRVERYLSTGLVDYGYDYIYPGDQDWMGIRKTSVDFGLFDVPISGDNFETEYKYSAYDIYTVGSADTYGQLYEVDLKKVYHFPDFWNYHYEEELGDRISYNRDSGESLNFKITKGLDRTKDYAILVTADDADDYGQYNLITEPHQDVSTFTDQTKRWIPYGTYRNSNDGKYYIESVIFHTRDTATAHAELLRLASEQTSLYMQLIAMGTEALGLFLVGYQVCAPTGPGGLVCGASVAVFGTISLFVTKLIVHNIATAEYNHVTDVCNAYFNRRPVGGLYVYVPTCRYGLKQVETVDSFLSINFYGDLYYDFSGVYGETLEAPKYLDGYWSLN